MKPNKQFDCIKMKNAIQEVILNETDGMNTEELLSYFNTGFNVEISGIYSSDRATVIEPDFPLTKELLRNKVDDIKNEGR